MQSVAPGVQTPEQAPFEQTEEHVAVVCQPEAPQVSTLSPVHWVEPTTQTEPESVVAPESVAVFASWPASVTVVELASDLASAPASDPWVEPESRPVAASATGFPVSGVSVEGSPPVFPSEVLGRAVGAAPGTSWGSAGLPSGAVSGAAEPHAVSVRAATT